MYGILNDGIKSSYVSFKAENLPRLKEKHGKNLRVIGEEVTLQPAAPSLATVVPSWQLPTAKPKLAQAEPVKEPRKKGTKPTAGGAKKVAKKAPKTSGNYKCRPIVSLTTGQCFDSIRHAATVTGGHPTSIHEQLSAKQRVRGINRQATVRKSVNGHVFRYATAEEIKLKQLIIDKPLTHGSMV